MAARARSSKIPAGQACVLISCIRFAGFTTAFLPCSWLPDQDQTAGRQTNIRSYPLSNLYPREVGLFVASGFKDLDLSQLVMRFSVTITGSEAANTASIRVYDLASGMAKRIQKDYQSVMLQAGH